MRRIVIAAAMSLCMVSLAAISSADQIETLEFFSVERAHPRAVSGSRLSAPAETGLGVRTVEPNDARSMMPAESAAVVPLAETHSFSTISIRCESRPALLPALYVGLAVIQSYDMYSTFGAMKLGAVEANPVMRGVVSSPPGFIAVKAGVTAVSIYAAERLWRNHRRGSAIALMVVSTGLMAVVSAHNASVFRGLR